MQYYWLRFHHINFATCAAVTIILNGWLKVKANNAIYATMSYIYTDVFMKTWQ